METGFKFQDIYDEAISRTGGEQSTAEDVIRVRRSLRIVAERWMTRGYNTWRIRKTVVWASGANDHVTLPVRVDDVIEVTRENGAELTRIPPDRYMALPQKLKEGIPSQFFLNREEQPKIYLFPVGQKGRPTPLTVWYVERPADFDRTENQMSDVPGRWLEAMICCVAYDLARKRPRPDGTFDEGLIQRLRGEANEAETTARYGDRDRSNYRFRMA